MIKMMAVYDQQKSPSIKSDLHRFNHCLDSIKVNLDF